VIASFLTIGFSSFAGQLGAVYLLLA